MAGEVPQKDLEVFRLSLCKDLFEDVRRVPIQTPTPHTHAPALQRKGLRALGLDVGRL